MQQRKLSFKNEVFRKTQLTEKKFLLINNQKEVSKEFKSLWTYVRNLLEYLWDEPYIISQIITNAKIEDIKNYLAPFFVNDFYENILSSDYVEGNLFYIISFLLKQEINNLSNFNNPENFLENTPCGIFLNQLIEKKDIKSFCKMIILNVVENLEWTFSSKAICFDIEKVHNILKKEKEVLNKNMKRKSQQFNENSNNLFKRTKTTSNFSRDNDSIDVSILSVMSSASNISIEKEFLNEKRNENNLVLFNSKYLPDITNVELNDKMNSYEKENNINMKEFIRYQIENNKKNDNNTNNDNNNKDKDNNNLYGNIVFINNLFNFEMSQELLSIYIISFLKTIETINLLFKNLIENMHFVPTSIKYICKIIYILIKKKFPEINKIELNAFMSRFFFNKILLPIFENPTFGALINEYIISKGTINNLKIVSNIISRLCLGRFYTSDYSNGNYTLFNRFFMERMPDVFTFFDDVIDITLPENINNLINDQLQVDFQSSYFRDNPDDIFFHRSILFCFDSLYNIIDNMKKNKNILFVNKNKKKLEETLNKLLSNINMKTLDEIKNNITYEIDENKGKNIEDNKIEIRKYFLINQLLINEKYSYILNINQEKPYFNIKELKKIKTEEEIIKNNIIKSKNLISSILYNYCKLNKEFYKKNKITDSISIFKEMKKYIKSSDFVVDETLPSEWYLDTFLETINKIPKNLSNNDYELLYNELKEDIINSINSLNFDVLSNLYENIKFAKRRKNIYKEEEKSLNDIFLNDKVDLIIEYTKIPCELNFCYNLKEKSINIRQLKKEDTSLLFLDSMTLKEPKKGSKICKTIKSFTTYFPNIIGYATFYGEDTKIFEILKQIKIPNTVDNYLKIIKNNMYKLKIWSTEEEFNNINNKIYDFVTEKVYDKIYPLVSSLNDIKIYNNCTKLSWTEPKHYINDKTNYSFESFLPDVIKYFKEFDKQKSPRKKIQLMKDIFNCINNIEELNGENANNVGIETQCAILTYAFIKAQPHNIDTNCNYLELFIQKDGEEDSLLTQIKAICKMVNEIEYSNLLGVSKEEFDSKFNNENEQNIDNIIYSVNTSIFNENK